MTEALELFRKSAESGEFLKLYNRLCVAFRENIDDTGITQNVYYDALSDLPLIALAKAADAMLRDSEQRFFPKVNEWRAFAESAYRQEFRAAVQPERDADWKLECEECEDTGWVHLDCTGRTCGRRNNHQAHRYVMPCACRQTNRTYLRHHTFGRSAGD